MRYWLKFKMWYKIHILKQPPLTISEAVTKSLHNPKIQALLAEQVKENNVFLRKHAKAKTIK